MKHNYLKHILLCLLSLTGISAFAYDAEIDGIYYNFYGDKAEVTYQIYDWYYYSDYSGAVVIPSSVTYNATTYSVTSIGELAFYGCSGLTSVTIGKSVTSIGDYALSDCSGLTSIKVETGNTKYDSRNNCNAIIETATNTLIAGCKNTIIPNSVTSIGDQAFYECSGLTSVTIPNSVTSIGDHAFYECSGLTSVTIPNSVTIIDEAAFYGCSGLTSVTIGNSVTGIGLCAFGDCRGLTSIKVGTGNTKYDSRNNCNAIIETATNTLIAGCKNTIIPNSVTRIGWYAFSGCTGLASITIPNSVTIIDEGAFYDCSGLTSITIPNSVTRIAGSVFSGCIGLTSFTIPNSVTSIGQNAFTRCYFLKANFINNSTVTDSNNWGATLCDEETSDGLLIKDIVIVVGCRPWVTTIIIPNSVTSIGDSAFRNCRGLTSVTIPNSVTSIGSYAFEGCSDLTSVTIGNNVTSIGNYAFDYCNSLTSVTLNSNTLVSANRSSSTSMKSIFGTQVKEYVIGNNVTGIGSNAFYGCSSLTSIIIPDSVTSIGEGAFSGCGGLTSVTIPNSVTSIGDHAFYGCTSLASVTIGNCVTSIGKGAFEDCSSLASVNIPNSVTSIGESVFYGCRSLTSVTIPNSVTSIGNYAFDFCNSLTSVTIPNSVTSIGVSAFSGCSGLTSVHIADLEAWCKIHFNTSSSNPLNYAHHLFMNGVEIKDLVIPNSVTSISGNAFSGCSGLTSVTIPKSVTSIGNNAFYECSGLTSVTIPNSVTSIEGSAFSGCSGLTSITIGRSVTSIGYFAFANCGSLKDVYCNAERVPIANATFAFSGTDISQATLHVPENLISEYSSTSPWNQFGTIVSSSDEGPTITGMQLDNSSFDEWSIVDSPSGKDLYQPWGEGKTPYWDTYNTFATTLSASNSTYADEDGRRYASLQTKFLVLKLVAGAIFTGSYIEVDGTNSVISLGQPFTERPAKMKFDFQYHSSTINRTGGTWKDAWGDYVSQSMYESLKGQPDSCQIYIALGDWDPVDYVDKNGVTHTSPYLIRTRPSQLHLFDPNDPHIIGYAQMTCGKDISSWTTETMDIHYRSDKTPKYIIVYATSSKYGDFSTGGEMSELKLDNIELLYGSIPDIDPEPVDSIPEDGGTFIEKLANGVEMEFKVISKEGKTCQVGSGTSHCINTNTTGAISIPNEVRRLSVVAIGDNAFSQCNDLSSVTLPSSVTSIGQFTFKDCKLHNILIKCEMPPDIEENAFTNQTFYHAMLYIPSGSWDAYAYDDNWYRFINIRETAMAEEDISEQQAYMLMDAETFAYSVYDPVNDCIGTINSIGSINEDNPYHSWQMIRAGGMHFLYNLGAKKYVKRDADALSLTDEPEPIDIANGDNGLILAGQSGKRCVLVCNESLSFSQAAIDQVTGIDSLTPSRSKGEGEIYNLAGQLLSKPQKGISIIGGRKVLVK